MKAKNLILLIVALAVLAGLAKWTRSKPSGRTAPAVPQKLVTFDVNSADQLTIAAGPQTTVLARAGETWVVRSLWDYPADFTTLAEQVRRLAGLEGLPVRGGEQALADFGLAPAAATNAPAAELITVTFQSAGRELGVVNLGNARTGRDDGSGMGGYPNGQYVRAAAGPVLLVKEYLGSLPRKPQDWITRSLVNVPKAEIEYLMVQATNGTSYGLLADTAGVFRVSGLTAGQEMKAELAESMAGALQNLSAVNVLDPKADPAATGLAHPATFVAKLKNGLTYTVKIGNPAAADNGRAVQLAVTYEKSEPPAPSITTNAAGVVTDAVKAFEERASAQAKQAQTEQARLAPWTFVVADYVAANFLRSREELIQPVTNAMPAAAAAPAEQPTPAAVEVVQPAAPQP